MSKRQDYYRKLYGRAPEVKRDLGRVAESLTDKDNTRIYLEEIEDRFCIYNLEYLDRRCNVELSKELMGEGHRGPQEDFLNMDDEFQLPSAPLFQNIIMSLHEYSQYAEFPQQQVLAQIKWRMRKTFYQSFLMTSTKVRYSADPNDKDIIFHGVGDEPQRAISAKLVDAGLIFQVCDDLPEEIASLCGTDKGSSIANANRWMFDRETCGWRLPESPSETIDIPVMIRKLNNKFTYSAWRKEEGYGLGIKIEFLDDIVSTKKL